MAPIVHGFADKDALARACADAVAGALVQAVQDYGEASCALAGGSTPRRMYEALAEHHRDSVPWQSVHFFWSDERCVHPGHPDSNFRVAHEALLSRVQAWQEKIHRMRGELDPATEAARYSQRLRQLFDDQLGEGEIVFDVMLLGMGADGHTASLFPADSAALAAREPCIAVDGQWGQPALPRLSLTLPVINTARLTILQVTGEEKRAALLGVLEGDAGAEQYPAARVRPTQGELHWYVEQALL